MIKITWENLTRVATIMIVLWALVQFEHNLSILQDRPNQDSMRILEIYFITISYINRVSKARLFSLSSLLTYSFNFFPIFPSFPRLKTCFSSCKYTILQGHFCGYLCKLPPSFMQHLKCTSRVQAIL